MSSKREQIIQALMAKLVSIPGVPNASVFRSREDLLNRPELPAIIVTVLSEDASVPMTGVIDWRMTFKVSIHIRGDVPDMIADPIMTDIYSKMMSDQSIGGLAMDLEPIGNSFQVDDGDMPIGLIEMDFEIKFRTKQNDLSQ